MKEVVEILARALVENPDQVVVEEDEAGKTVRIRLIVAREDVGKVIGKQGRIANAIRTVAKAAAVKNGRRIIVEID